MPDERDKIITALEGDVEKLNSALMDAWQERDQALNTLQRERQDRILDPETNTKDNTLFGEIRHLIDDIPNAEKGSLRSQMHQRINRIQAKFNEIYDAYKYNINQFDGLTEMYNMTVGGMMQIVMRIRKMQEKYPYLKDGLPEKVDELI